MWADRLSRILKPLLMLAGVVFLPAAVYGLYKGSRFSEYPRHPDPATGQVIPYFWKTVTIYVTRPEATALGIADVMGLPFLFVLAAFLTTRFIARRSNP